MSKNSSGPPASGSWRYDLAIFVNKQREASDFGYILKSPDFPSFKCLLEKLLEDTIRILPAVLSSKTHRYLGLSATIVAATPKELIGPTELDESSWLKIEHEICRLVDQKPKRNLTLSLRVDYVPISTGSMANHCPSSAGSRSTGSMSKGNRKMVR